jgi:hypothetical protein
MDCHEHGDCSLGGAALVAKDFYWHTNNATLDCTLDKITR